MTVINTNIKALYTQSALKVSERDSVVAMQQLATGKRINSSKDDAAGLAIAARMSQNILGLGQSIRNAGDAISMIQTAEGATQEITVMLQRMSELAVQASNSTYSDEQRGYLNQEFQQLKQEIVRISDTHEWNGFPILNGKAGTPVGLPATATATRAGVAATASGKVEAGAVAQVSQISITSPQDVVTSTLAGTYIEFADMGTATESLSIPNYNGFDGGAGPASASGAISFQSGILYRGDGTNPIAIGSVDSNLNGTLGKPLRINLGYVFSDAANQFFNPANQHFYEVVTPSSPKTWQQAKDLAQSRSLFSLNGYLATVTDASEQSFINGQLAGKEGWIGASDQDVSLGGLGEGNWAWLTGPEAGTLFYKGRSNTGAALASKFANWSSGEPNDSGNNEDYAYIKTNGQWNDYAASVTVGSYVVEYGGGGAFGTYAAPTLTATDLQNIRARVIYSDSSANKDTASVTINGQTITSAPALRGGESIATALETAINASINAGTLQNVVVQRYGNTLNLQSTVPGTAFDLSAASTNHSGNIISAQTVTENKTTGTKALETGDLEIQTDKGSYAIPASIAASDPKSNTIAAGSNNAGSAIAIAAAINSQVGLTGVSAVAGAATIGATKTTVGNTSIQSDLYVNGEKVSLSLSASHTLSQRRQYVMESINACTAVHGVVAGDSGTGGLTLTTPDGRNLSVWYDSTSVQGSDFGLGLDTTPPSNPLGVTGVSGAAASSFGANESNTVTFPQLTAGQGFTLNGLTFTSTGSTTNNELAAAFSNLKSGMSALAAAAANPTAMTKGSFSGTFAEGFTTGNATTNLVTATATGKGNVGNIVTSDSVPTIVKTDGALLGGSIRQEYADVTFRDLANGESYTLAGISIFGRGNGVSAANVAAVFANKFDGTSLPVEINANGYEITSVDRTLVGYHTGPVSGNTVRFTAVGSSGNVTDLAVRAGSSTPSAVSIVVSQGERTDRGTTESSVITFKALNPNDFVTVNGLTFTARVNMTANEVAAVFSNIASGSTAAALTLANPVAANFGKYSGTFTAGFSTGASTSTANVTATSITANTNVTDLAVNGVVAATSTSTSPGSTVAASTVYGTVTLNSQNAFTIKPGAKAYASANAPALDPTYANFTALGFEAKTINAKSIGRLNFQVGPAANQLISIDLADFGKNGDITGLITSDRAPTNLLTVNSSNDVIMNVNKSLDRIAATRATMGAVMNRLEHVIDNLTNVVMNSEASRSRIEDADYAQASTELAKTQIKQQAATAVLAQANSSSQMVLKLLEQN
jgi:flagellin